MSGERRSDPHRLLVRALHARAGGAPAAIVETARTEAWASATFRGARHSIALSLAGADAPERADRLAGEMDGIEFTLPGHLVADIAVMARVDRPHRVSLAIEALTVEDS